MTVVNYRVADINIRLHADLPITGETFSRKLDIFTTGESGEDILSLHHHFSMPADTSNSTYQLITEHIPWTIYRNGPSWIYDGHYRYPSGLRQFLRVEWNAEHAHGDIYHPDAARFKRGGLEALTGMTTDQIFLARVLADRKGCLLHAAGMSLSASGLLFIGHSHTGKSTIVEMLRGDGEVLCDDRVVVRRMPEGFRLYGTWCHSDVPEISPTSAPVKAICFLEKADTNQAIPLTDRREILGRLLPCLVKPYVDAEWWQKTLSTVDSLIETVPAYRLLFDRSGRIVKELRELSVGDCPGPP